MRQFAEAEVFIKTGRYPGKFRCETQPFSHLLFDAIESGNWQRFFITGPTQSGKTTIAFVIPILYHLFEIGETVVVGLPNMDIAKDVWRDRIKPAIAATQYAKHLPKHGAGSQGGTPVALEFGNGTVLRFMAGGGDKARSSFTTRVLVMTEVDGMDEASETSREADKVSQMEARTDGWDDLRRIYGECTISIPEGRTNQEYTKGTCSRIFLPCPKCLEWVSPERESLVGHQGAETVIDARENSRFYCPKCGEGWTEAERRQANLLAKLVHRGQTIGRDGAIEGPLPKTDTLGFRWSAVNNLFVSAGTIGAKEWNAVHKGDDENNEKALRQYTWVLPVENDKVDTTPLDQQEICKRQHDTPKGIKPVGLLRMAVGIDVGWHNLHFVVAGEAGGPRYPVIDYGVRDVSSNDYGVELGIMKALREFKDIIEAGWNGVVPEEVWIDSGDESEAVYAFCREAGPRYRPSKGWGALRWHSVAYNTPTKTGPDVRFIGEGYHFSRLKKPDLVISHMDVDYWKTKVHQRLTSPIKEPAAITLFQAPHVQHLTFAKHLTAEKKVEIFEAGKGLTVRWEKHKKQNHYFDATVMAMACLRHLGQSVVPDVQQPEVVTDWFKKQQEGRRGG